MKWLEERKLKKIEKHIDRMPALTQREKMELTIKTMEPEP